MDISLFSPTKKCLQYSPAVHYYGLLRIMLRRVRFVLLKRSVEIGIMKNSRKSLMLKKGFAFTSSGKVSVINMFIDRECIIEFLNRFKTIHSWQVKHSKIKANMKIRKITFIFFLSLIDFIDSWKFRPLDESKMIIRFINVDGKLGKILFDEWKILSRSAVKYRNHTM